MHILTITNLPEEKFLRQKTKSVDLIKADKKLLRKTIRQMRQLMKTVKGVGLSANQIGLDQKFFIAEVENKFYAIFNPEITKFSREKNLLEEGCLSVPETLGEIERSQKITLEGQDVMGKKIKIKAWGMLAQVFQHEVGHLNGKLFIDKANQIKKNINE